MPIKTQTFPRSNTARVMAEQVLTPLPGRQQKSKLPICGPHRIHTSHPVPVSHPIPASHTVPASHPVHIPAPCIRLGDLRGRWGRPALRGTEQVQGGCLLTQWVRGLSRPLLFTISRLGDITAAVADAPSTTWGLDFMPGERDPGEAGEGVLKAWGTGPPGPGTAMVHPAAALF